MSPEKKPLKTSAVIITAKNNQVSYSEVLRWARQNVKTTDEETRAVNKKVGYRRYPPRI